MKFENMEYTITDPSHSNYTLSHALNYEGYNMGRINTPGEGEIVTVIKNFTIDELNKLLNGNYFVEKKYSHIKWKSKLFSIDNECLYETDHLTKNKDNVKPSPFKIGRFVNALLTKAGVEFSPKDIEAFVDKFKAEMMKRKNIFETNFEIVKGNDIREYYLEDNKIKPQFIKVIDKQLIYQKIDSLKEELVNSDYKVIKQYEAIINNLSLPYNSSDFEEREKIRIKIRELENLLKETA